MSFDDLKSLKNQASLLENVAQREDRIQELLRMARRKPCNWHGSWTAIENHVERNGAKEALYEVLDEMRHDIFRLAEMRLEAKARLNRVKAAQCNAILSACILPLPKMEESEQ